ncbi:hypothetical protein JK364_49575 [Streptomyces sp. 110]|uniref:Uncharacterized protein n=1 Tax=Streptomyces endocoffeicus TaxID=2898945 RepID=A0ABS1Q6I7_9ACTN|nr:hypothetical protein [Streptomyces endocoffeicus]MBL1120290.1 hypothetical protein [Streptomyces endocoffeicus]
MSHRDVPRSMLDVGRGTTSTATETAAIDALTARRWEAGRGLCMRPTGMGPDYIFIAPVIGEDDQMPGAGGAWEGPHDKRAWFLAADRLQRDLLDAGWTSHGHGPTGTLFKRPAPAAVQQLASDGASLSDAPPGASVRLLAIAQEVGVTGGMLGKAVLQAARRDMPETPDGDAAELPHGQAAQKAKSINDMGMAAQLVFLYEGYVSEAAFRSFLEELSAS